MASNASCAACFLLDLRCRVFQERWFGSFLCLGARFGMLVSVKVWGYCGALCAPSSVMTVLVWQDTPPEREESS